MPSHASEIDAHSPKARTLGAARSADNNTATEQDQPAAAEESPLFGPNRPVQEALSELQIVERVEGLILGALPKRLSERAIARTLGIKIPDLRRSFANVRGIQMYSALHALRLDMVHRFLTENPSAIPEAVASQYGFGHYGVFHRNYRRRFGRDPGSLPSAPAPQPSSAGEP